jgi:beta-N-acetylhexosaminidase
VAALTASVHDANPMASVAVDEEGGDVTRLHATTGSPALAAAALGHLDDLDATRSTGAAIGRDLAAVGVDLDLGPVADLNTDPRNPVIGARSFGTDPHRVGEHVAAWVTGLQSTGVRACLKHFPGHGDTHVDSHLALPVVPVGRDVLDRRELVPFVAGAQAGAASVMTSHLVVTALDADRPATLSAAVLALAREVLGDDVVVVTDALDMAGASAGRGIPEAAVLSLVAGADLLCLGPDTGVETTREIAAAVAAAVRSGRLPEERLADAAHRAATLRATAFDPTGTRSVVDATGSVEVVGTLPDLTRALVLKAQTDVSIAIGVVPWGVSTEPPVSPADLPARAGSHEGPVVVETRDAHRHPDLVAAVGSLARGRDVVVVDYGWPGPWGLPVPRVLTRGGSRPAYDVVAGLLRARGWSG